MNQGGCISNMGASNPFSACHLVPRNGNRLLIGGVNQIIPNGSLSSSGGVIGTYSNCSINRTPGQSLAANTDYYIYACMVAGVMTLDFSQTAPEICPTYGIWVKTGDSACTLVGFLHTDANGKTLGTAKDQTIVSYYNRMRYRLETSIDGSTTSASWVELNSANRLQWVQWDDDLPTGPTAFANWGSTVAQDTPYMGIGLNSSATTNGYTGRGFAPNTAAPSHPVFARAQNPGNSTKGQFFYATVLAKRGGTGTCSITGSAVMCLDNNAV